MKLLLDFFPILLFFIAYKTYDIYVATVVAIVASLVQVLYSRYSTGKFEKMHLITLGLIAVFGGATLVLQDEIFIKWKPTVVNWLFAAVFLGSQFVGKQNVAQRLMGAALTLPDHVWRRINWSWVYFFFALGVINIYVIYNFDTDTWVNFKLFGMLGLTVAFMIAQGLYLARYIKE
ncbi:MAG: septation protein A [Gammaproteobacteria bacterium]|nr:septation protein A [Gammaproteobacteria bacterium]